jgi:lysophospholipase L1-like esterase
VARFLALYAALTTALLLAGAGWFGLRTWSHARETPPPHILGAAEARAPQLKGAIVFLGDSRIAFLATSNVADRAENVGVAGQDLADLAAQLKGVDLSGASGFVLEAGVNDWWKARDLDFRARYAAVLQELPPGRPLIAAAILPVDADADLRAYGGYYDWRGANSYVARWNAVIADLCGQRSGCTFVPVPAALLLGDHLNAAMTLDGVHLNAMGAAIWGDALRRALSQTGTTAPSMPGR